MTLGAVSAIRLELHVRRTAASLRSLIGIPIVLVMLTIEFALSKIDRRGGEVVRVADDRMSSVRRTSCKVRRSRRRSRQYSRSAEAGIVEWRKL